MITVSHMYSTHQPVTEEEVGAFSCHDELVQFCVHLLQQTRHQLCASSKTHQRSSTPYRPTVTWLRIGELIWSTSDSSQSLQDHNILHSGLPLVYLALHMANSLYTSGRFALAHLLNVLRLNWAKSFAACAGRKQGKTPYLPTYIHT